MKQAPNHQIFPRVKQVPAPSVEGHIHLGVRHGRSLKVDAIARSVEFSANDKKYLRTEDMYVHLLFFSLLNPQCPLSTALI